MFRCREILMLASVRRKNNHTVFRFSKSKKLKDLVTI